MKRRTRHLGLLVAGTVGTLVVLASVAQVRAQVPTRTPAPRGSFTVTCPAASTLKHHLYGVQGGWRWNGGGSSVEYAKSAWHGTAPNLYVSCTYIGHPHQELSIAKDIKSSGCVRSRPGVFQCAPP